MASMIKGFRRARLPRIAKIGLGGKVLKGDREFPTDLNHFDLSECPEVAEVYGPEPTELDVMVPSPDISEWFPVALKRYGTDRLLCRGDGETAGVFDPATGEFEEIACGYKSCPYFQEKRCTEVGNLMLILPRVNIMGVYQIDTGSWYGINDVYNAYEMALQRILDVTGNPDDILRVPFRLVRVPTVIPYTATNKDGSTVRKTVTKAILNLIPPSLSLEDAKQLHAAAARERQQLVAGVHPGARPALPSGPAVVDDFGADEGEFDLPPVVEPDESMPAGLYPGEAPPAADLGQRTAWAALLEQAAKCGKAPAQVEQSVCRGAGKADKFADLSTEQATTAIEALTKLVQIWQALPEEGTQAAPAAEGGGEAQGAEEAGSCPTAAQLEEYEALLGELGQVGAKVEVSLRNALKAAGSPDGAFETLQEAQAEQALGTLRAIRDAGVELQRQRAAQAAAQAPAAAPEQSQEETPQAAPAAAAAPKAAQAKPTGRSGARQKPSAASQTQMTGGF
jgi:hypothetical protein